MKRWRCWSAISEISLRYALFWMRGEKGESDLHVTRHTSHLDSSIEPISEDEKVCNREKIPIQKVKPAGEGGQEEGRGSGTDKRRTVSQAAL